MKNAKVVTGALIFMLLMGCRTTKLTQQYKNPETATFQANKVLIVGITADKDLRRSFENKMMESLEKDGVIAVKSIDFFEKSFTDNKQSLKQLNAIETSLLEAGFDAILFTKITNKESRVTVVDAYRNFSNNYPTFEDYYYGNQHVYFKEQQERYQVYTTETSLFCICPGKEPELLWQGIIEVVDANKVDRNITTYINLLLKTLKENNLLVLNE